MTNAIWLNLEAYELLLSLVRTLAFLLIGAPFQLVCSHTCLKIQQLKAVCSIAHTFSSRLFIHKNIESSEQAELQGYSNVPLVTTPSDIF